MPLYHNWREFLCGEIKEKGHKGSLSETYGFKPTDSPDVGMKFLRHENGSDVYFDELAGKEVFVGRTGIV